MPNLGLEIVWFEGSVCTFPELSFFKELLRDNNVQIISPGARCLNYLFELGFCMIL